MSEASKRGQKLEREIAAIIRKKTGVLAVRDSRSGANWHRRSDIFTELPIHIEAKDHETIKIKEFYRQAEAAASFNQTAVAAFRCDEFILATLEFHKLIDLFVEVADLRAEIEDLRRPIIQPNIVPKVADKILDDLEKPVKQMINRGSNTCKAGHLADSYGYCMQVKCPFSRGYRKPKAKKGRKA